MLAQAQEDPQAYLESVPGDLTTHAENIAVQNGRQGGLHFPDPSGGVAFMGGPHPVASTMTAGLQMHPGQHPQMLGWMGDGSSQMHLQGPHADYPAEYSQGPGGQLMVEPFAGSMMMPSPMPVPPGLVAGHVSPSVRFLCVTEVAKTSSACAACTRRREQKLDPAQQCRDCSHISKRRRKQGIQVEIIQLVCSMYDTYTQQVVGDFSHMLQPVHLPLTRFCTATTGISTREAEAAEPLESVLRAHARWVQALTGHPDNMLLVTCGDFLCDALIPRQCERVPMPVPHYMNKWVNIKHAFEALYPTKAGPISQMCQHLGISVEGSTHHAINDCQMMVLLLENVLKSGLDMNFLLSLVGDRQSCRDAGERLRGGRVTTQAMSGSNSGGKGNSGNGGKGKGNGVNTPRRRNRNA